MFRHEHEHDGINNGGVTAAREGTCGRKPRPAIYCGMPYVVFQMNLSRRCVESKGSRMPSHSDSVNLFRVLTSDWHPRLLHDVALRLKGERGLIDVVKASAR
jgi:hypothetical protein